MAIPSFHTPFLLITTLFIFSSPYLYSTCTADDQPIDLFTSCLIHHNIHNFTSHSNSYNDSSSSTYYHLLTFSIQNLRFSEPSLPKPIVVVFPGSKEELMSSVECSRESGLEIRVRCGGHSYEGTSSVTSDGGPFVVIDMSKLERVLVDMEEESAWVEGGATLGQVYYAISESSGVHGFPAGSCPTVGVGGHISGGGYGLLSRKYGLAADNVLDALLVTADGLLLDREAMGEDVFWAIRGGGGGVLGIVYAWKIRILKVPNTVTSFVVSRHGTKAQVANLVLKWQHVAPNLDDDFYLSSFVGAGLPQRKEIGISATFKGFFLGPGSKALAIINHAFPDLKIVKEDCKEMSWIESIIYFGGLDEGATISDLKNRYLQDKHYYKAKSDYVRTPISRSGLNTFLDVLEKEPKGYVILDPYGGIMQNISSEAIAFPHRKGNMYTIQYLVEWHDKDNTKSGQYTDWIRGFYSSMTPYVSSGPRAAYVNYMDLDLGVSDLISTKVSTSWDQVEMARNWGEKYFLKNYDRLVKAKTLVDPNNVFRHQQGIPPFSKGQRHSG